MTQINNSSVICMNCRSCLLACSIEKSKKKILFEAILEATPVVSCIRLQKENETFTLKKCQHCADAPCIKSCPVGALKRDPEFGQVFIDHSHCISCGICSQMCPENAITIKYAKVYKCDGCLDRLRRNQPPACHYACPTGAIKTIFKK